MDALSLASNPPRPKRKTQPSSTETSPSKRQRSPDIERATPNKAMSIESSKDGTVKQSFIMSSRAEHDAERARASRSPAELNDGGLDRPFPAPAGKKKTRRWLRDDDEGAISISSEADVDYALLVSETISEGDTRRERFADGSSSSFALKSAGAKANVARAHKLQRGDSGDEPIDLCIWSAPCEAEGDSRARAGGLVPARAFTPLAPEQIATASGYKNPHAPVPSSSLIGSSTLNHQHSSAQRQRGSSMPPKRSPFYGIPETKDHVTTNHPVPNLLQLELREASSHHRNPRALMLSSALNRPASNSPHWQLNPRAPSFEHPHLSPNFDMANKSRATENKKHKKLVEQERRDDTKRSSTELEARVKALGSEEIDEDTLKALCARPNQSVMQLASMLSIENCEKLQVYIAGMPGRFAFSDEDSDEDMWTSDAGPEYFGPLMEGSSKLDGNGVVGSMASTTIGHIKNSLMQGGAALQLVGSQLINSMLTPQLGALVATAPIAPIVHQATVAPKFEKFMELPPELRERIFEDALNVGHAIQPHLCTRDNHGKIKFHNDAMETDHCGIDHLLGVTRVSKQIRAESLPCFYSANTFVVGYDTAIYFTHLEHLGRFHMIRQVKFEILMRLEKRAAETLQHMNKYLRDVETYETSVTRPAVDAQDQAVEWLRNHPSYITGGDHNLSMIVCLRMLTSRFTESPNATIDGSGQCQGYTSKLVLPIPSAKAFKDYATFKWFPKVCHGLGIHLHFLEGHELTYYRPEGIGLTWHQQYQKKDFQQELENVDVKGRILDMFPEVNDAAETGGYLNYYRHHCGPDRPMQWFKAER